MTVKELILVLSTYPDDLRVVRRGYEGGFADLQNAEYILLILNAYPKTQWWDGPHERAQPGDPFDCEGLLL